MTSDLLISWATSVLIPAGLIVLVAAAIASTLTLRFPQLTGWLSAFRGLGQDDAESDGDYSPVTAVLLSTAALYGTAAAAGATLVAGSGGVAVIGWAWLFVIIMSPLAVAEALLARTGVPGDDKGPSGSLTERLRRSDVAYVRLLGKGLFVSLILCSLTFLGGAHGQGVLDASAHVLPNESATLLFGCAGIAAALAIAGPLRAGTLTGWLAAAGFLALAVATLWGSIANLSQGLTAIPRGFADAVNGTSAIPPFMGISPGQLFGLVCAGLALPLMAASGLGGALHAGARARATGTQARSAMLGLLVFAMLTTLVGISAQSTGSYFRAETTTAKVMDLTVYRVIPETASQRAEEDRLFTGVLRILEGELRDRGPVFATDTGRVELGHFSVDGEPADVALRFQDGRLISMLRPQEQGLLDEVSVDQWGSLTLTGEMLSADMGAWLSGLDRGAGNGLASRLALMGLLLLLVAGAGAWGMALARSAPATFPVALRTVLAIVPAASVALTTSESLLPWLHGAGALSAGLVAILTGIAILLHAREAGRLFR